MQQVKPGAVYLRPNQRFRRSLTARFFDKISPAIETYVLEADKEAKKFLQKNQEMVIDYLFQCAEADNRALIGYLNLGLLSGQTLQDILHRFSDTENAEITACILEQIHKLQAGG